MSIASLWLPVLVSGVAVFVASSVMHMVLAYHQKDYAQLPDEDGVMNALRPFDLPPGDYMMPGGEGMESFKDEAFLEKWSRGPVGMLTIWKSERPNMAASLIQWFLYCLLIGLFVAVLATTALPADVHTHLIFHQTALTAFGGYTLALLQNSIWGRQQWRSTFRYIIDGLVFGVITGLCFMWLWPAAA